MLITTTKNKKKMKKSLAIAIYTYLDLVELQSELIDLHL